MAKVIIQETFDDVVKENIVEFSMDPVEAQEETIQQFEAQGINLGNIVKDLSRNPDTGVPILNEIIDALKKHTNEENLTDIQKVLEYLKELEQECNKSLPHRVLAAKYGASDAVMALLKREINTEKPNNELIASCLRGFNSLTNKQPDIFDNGALETAMKILSMDELSSDDIRCLTLQWLQKACIMHEFNRTTIMQAGILKQLKPIILANEKNEHLLRDILAVFRYLVLDDDIRVEFGNAHEHARLIASELIVDLTKLLDEFNDVVVLSDIILTIGTLAVRQEFCTTIEEAGGLQFIIKIMDAFKENVRLNRESLKLLRALAGNDLVKVHMVQQGVAPIIKDILIIHKANESIATAALACISTLTLRVKENSAAFFDAGIAEILVETMLLHPNNKTVQRNGAWAIRNMVSRSRDQCETWLSYNIEEALNFAMKEHPSIAQDIKAALRDLGCKVSFKEEWTGVAEKKILKG